MKGIIFNLLETSVRRTYGDATWAALRKQTSLSHTYLPSGNYPDEELFRFVGAAAHALKLPAGDLLRWFGRSAMPALAVRYSDLFAGHRRTAPFLATINDVIHSEVRKLYPDADLPKFELSMASDTEISLTYRSGRRLCALAEGFIEGAAQHFGEAVSIQQPICMLKGGDRCVIACRFEKPKGDAAHD